MTGYIRLQDVKDIGLLLYCYFLHLIPLIFTLLLLIFFQYIFFIFLQYYDLPLDEQRKALFNELNSYGFNFKETDLGLDKLRTLYFGKPMFSKNQNA